jgi:hypothetical protein
VLSSLSRALTPTFSVVFISKTSTSGAVCRPEARRRSWGIWAGAMLNFALTEF